MSSLKSEYPIIPADGTRTDNHPHHHHHVHLLDGFRGDRSRHDNRYVISLSPHSFVCSLHALVGGAQVEAAQLRMSVELQVFMAEQPFPSIALPAARWTPTLRRHVGTARLLYAFSG